MGLHGEHGGGVLYIRLIGHQVQLGLGEDGGLGVVKQLLGDVLHVVAVEDAHAGQGLEAQEGPGVRQQRSGLRGKARLFLYIDSEYHAYPSNAARARWPMSRRQYAFSKVTP